MSVDVDRSVFGPHHLDVETLRRGRIISKLRSRISRHVVRHDETRALSPRLGDSLARARFAAQYDANCPSQPDPGCCSRLTIVGSHGAVKEYLKPSESLWVLTLLVTIFSEIPASSRSVTKLVNSRTVPSATHVR
jgi:hypothetical protein